jgi:DNA-binding beta-propeller fold protein YncE
VGSANDDRGIEVSRTAVQTVYLAAAGVRPTASSTLAFESRSTGNARLWVVNRTTTRTVFDAVTHAKVREINVGIAPRSIAVAPGRIWVTNRQSATISVIDPGALAVSNRRTAARRNVHRVRSGRRARVRRARRYRPLVKLDATTFAQTGSVSVAEPRHVAIAPTVVYVSRFSSPTPGEHRDVRRRPTKGRQVVVVKSNTLA